MRCGADPIVTRQLLERLAPNIQVVLDNDDILGGRYPAGYAEVPSEVRESADGRFLTSKLDVALVAPA